MCLRGSSLGVLGLCVAVNAIACASGEPLSQLGGNAGNGGVGIGSSGDNRGDSTTFALKANIARTTFVAVRRIKQPAGTDAQAFSSTRLLEVREPTHALAHSGVAAVFAPAANAHHGQAESPI